MKLAFFPYISSKNLKNAVYFTVLMLKIDFLGFTPETGSIPDSPSTDNAMEYY
jgi:hypothetical protein